MSPAVTARAMAPPFRGTWSSFCTAASGGPRSRPSACFTGRAASTVGCSPAGLPASDGVRAPSATQPPRENRDDSCRMSDAMVTCVSAPPLRPKGPILRTNLNPNPNQSQRPRGRQVRGRRKHTPEDAGAAALADATRRAAARACTAAPRQILHLLSNMIALITPRASHAAFPHETSTSNRPENARRTRPTRRRPSTFGASVRRRLRLSASGGGGVQKTPVASAGGFFP
mmetsp:Transcript_31679/g.100615  ORF Transcript_31679/g.100615 Transcript_31679/m.100615 type:complete len:229 (-) Transcript_31679:10-696(-)